MEYLKELAVVLIIPVAIFCIEDIWKLLFVSPRMEYGKLKGEIAYSLTLHANKYSNVIDLADKDEKQIEKYEEVSHNFRDLASRLFACAEMRRWYNIGIPSKKKLFEAARHLIGISNGMFCPYNTHRGHDINIVNQENEEIIRKMLSLEKR